MDEKPIPKTFEESTEYTDAAKALFRALSTKHECSICGEQYGYRLDEEFAALLFDPSCGCPGGGNERVARWDEIRELPTASPQTAPEP